MRPPRRDGPGADEGTTSSAPGPGARIPTLAHGDRDAAFLNAPGLGADELAEIVGRVLAEMAGDAILTVFTDQPGMSEAVAAWCTAHGVELVAVIAHEAVGETLAVRRAGIA